MTNILYEAHGKVMLITINRPAKMNSLVLAGNDEFVESWNAFDADEEA